MSILAIVGTTAAVLTALGIIWHRGILPLYRFCKRAHLMFESVQRVEKYTQQLTPNSGSHMFDAVKRTELKTDAVAKQVTDLTARIDRIGLEQVQDSADIWKALAARDIHYEVKNISGGKE